MSLTNIIALDCEMVGVGRRRERIDQLARVSVVNEYETCIYDTFVYPEYVVTDYRTRITGITKRDLMNGRDFAEVREDIRSMIKGRIIVGHSLKHDLKVLRLSHPDWNKRDTAEYPPFIEMNRNRTPSLKWLARRILGWNIQNGQHSSIEDALAAMRIYKWNSDEWESWLEDSESEYESESDQSESESDQYVYDTSSSDYY